MTDAYYNEIADYPAAVLRRRIKCGDLPSGKVDKRSIADVRPDDIGDGPAHFFAGIGGWPLALRWAGVPDDAPIWTGSCPCQPFSSANVRKRGDDVRDLWPTWRKLIEERRPSIVFGEQVADGAWLARARCDLERIGYAVCCAALCASLVGLPPRVRFFFAAYDDSQGESSSAIHEGHLACVREAQRMVERERTFVRRLRRDGDGIPCNVGARRGLGNAIVPALAGIFVGCALDAIAGQCR